MDSNDRTSSQEQTAADKVDEAARAERVIRKQILRQYRHSLSWVAARDKLAAGTPLFAALVAPISTLYDIPALTERWYALDGTEVPDPAANLALSACGLAFNAMANGLLIFRFTARPAWWRAAMILSTVCWVLKSIIATVNLAVYGHSHESLPGYTYTSAFWCGVISCILASVIATTLVLYMIVAGMAHHIDTEETRVQARHFMLGELGLFCTLAFEALIFSKIERWSFFDGLYFSLVVALTIGYGDLVPTRRSTKVLLFPFAIITVAFLASQVSVIIQFFGEHTANRRRRWRKIYEDNRRQESVSSQTDIEHELVEEMGFLKRLAEQEDRMSRTSDLSLSFAGFVTFWLVGAAAYHAIEGWTFGDSVYFCYVTFFTIGFGDFSPTTAAGQAFFIIYALVAVPLIASFAVQTVVSIWSAARDRRLEKDKVKRGVEPSLDRRTTLSINVRNEEVEIHPFISHSELVARYHKSILQPVTTDHTVELLQLDVSVDRVSRSDSHELAIRSVTQSKPAETTAGVHKKEIEMLDELLAQVLDLESRARRLLINTFEHGSKPRLLLQADKNLMDRAQTLLNPRCGAEADDQQREAKEPAELLSDLEEIHMYRQAFAKFLVCGTRLRQLQGVDQLLFERRRGHPYVNGTPVELDETPQ